MIANAFQRGSSVYVNDAHGRTLFVKTGELHAFTGSSVTICLSGNLQTFDERGMLLDSVRT